MIAREFGGLQSNNFGPEVQQWTVILEDGRVVTTRPDFIDSLGITEVKSKRTPRSSKKSPSVYRTKQIRAEQKGARERGLIYRLIVETNEIDPERFPRISRSFGDETRIRLVAGVGHDGLRQIYRYIDGQWVPVEEEDNDDDSVSVPTERGPGDHHKKGGPGGSGPSGGSAPGFLGGSIMGAGMMMSLIRGK